MIRSILRRCALFGSLSYRDLATLFGCLGASTVFLAPGGKLLTDCIAVVLSGGVLEGGRLFGPSEVALGSCRARTLTANQPSEVLLLPPARLSAVCKNTCEFHRIVIANLLRLSLASMPPVAERIAPSTPLSTVSPAVRVPPKLEQLRAPQRPVCTRQFPCTSVYMKL